VARFPSWVSNFAPDLNTSCAYLLITLIIALGEHISNITRIHMEKFWAKERKYELGRGFSGKEVGTFAPVMLVRQLDKVDTVPRGQGGKIQSAAVQGGMNRAVDRVYNGLLHFIRQDPEAWGYQLDKTTKEEVYVEIEGLPEAARPFKLAMLGSPPEPPKPIQNVVQSYWRPSYETMFTRIHQADLVLPAFGEDSNYIKDKASSTMGIALSARTPMLLTAEEEAAYGYFPSDFVVRRPHYMSEMEFIHASRIGKINYDRVKHSDARLLKARDGLLVRNAQLLAEMFQRPLVAMPDDASLAVHFRFELDRKMKEEAEKKAAEEKKKEEEETQKTASG
jgi:hypothetical protein